MRKQFIIVFLVSVFSSAVLANFETAMQAFDRRDYQQALRELEPLAEAGDPYAQYMLGRLYAAGNGVIQDFIEAHKWFNLAAARNHGHAAQARDATAARMTPAQIGRAQELARRWQPGSSGGGGRDDAPRDDRENPRRIIAGIQDGLNRLGYDAGPVDGSMGRRTRQAIVEYQADTGLRQTGEPTRDLLEHIQRTQSQSQDQSSDGNDRDRSWSRLILSDRFDDGDYTRNPRWTVAAGEFRIDRGNGLRSIAAPYRSFDRPQSRENTAEEIGLAVLQAILQQAAGIPNQPAQSEYAEIYVPARIDNAFALELVLNARDTSGPLEFGVYQGRSRDTGYRVIIAPEGRLVLVSLARSGSAVVQTSRRSVNIDDGRQHNLRWVRRPDGRMSIAMDQREVINARDRSFRDEFSGFAWINRGGDYGLRQIEIFGR